MTRKNVFLECKDDSHRKTDINIRHHNDRWKEKVKLTIISTDPDKGFDQFNSLS